MDLEGSADLDDLTVELRRILEERAITRQLAVLCRAMDERDWVTVSAIFVEDATGCFGGVELHSREAIVANLRSWLTRCGTTQHLLGTTIIDLDPDRRQATSRSYVFDRHLAKDERASEVFATLGDYEDHWCLDGRTWRLQRRVKHSRDRTGSLMVFDDE